jgi:hypothetical protein
MPNSGLYYYGYRFYDPNLQRWLNRDPVLERGGVNVFSFVKNDAVDWFDGYGTKRRRVIPITPIPRPPIRNYPNPSVPDPNKSTIMCRGNRYVVVNKSTGPASYCVAQHELQHIGDWKDRYGEDSCRGVPDGNLPMGDAGYPEFLIASECRAHRADLDCYRKLPCLSPAWQAYVDGLIQESLEYLQNHNCP